MLRTLAKRGAFVRALGVLSVALVCVLGALQAAHAHPNGSTVSHHSCTLCVAAQAGIGERELVFAPTLVAVSLAVLPSTESQIVRPGLALFSRPPPSF